MRAHVVVLALAAALCASTLGTSASAQVVSPRTVLTITLGAESFPSSPILDAAIRESLASRPDVPIDYFAEHLESDLFPEEQASPALKDYIHRKFQGRRIDLVIASDRYGRCGSCWTTAKSCIRARRSFLQGSPSRRSPAAPVAGSPESRSELHTLRR